MTANHRAAKHPANNLELVIQYNDDPEKPEALHVDGQGGYWIDRKPVTLLAAFRWVAAHELKGDGGTTFNQKHLAGLYDEVAKRASEKREQVMEKVPEPPARDNKFDVPAVLEALASGYHEITVPIHLTGEEWLKLAIIAKGNNYSNNPSEALGMAISQCLDYSFNSSTLAPPLYEAMLDCGVERETKA